MLGWEYPPFYAGGLGIACQGLIESLKDKVSQINFCLPLAKNQSSEIVEFGNVKIIPALKKRSSSQFSEAEHYYTQTYKTSLVYDSISKKYINESFIQLSKEIHSFSEEIANLAEELDFDIIHAHDWLTYLAGVRVKEKTGKPLVVHVHATFYDQAGANKDDGNEQVQVEKLGFEKADKIVAVSNYTKNILQNHYGIDSSKVEVVHNAAPVDISLDKTFMKNKPFKKLVLFLGRVTLQKGPLQFVWTAKRVLDVDPNVMFMVAGTGDMLHEVMEETARLGIAEHFIFSGFVTRDKIKDIFKMANIYVCSSISEPFGIVPFEALQNGTPVILSKQSGVSEVITHCCKVDFWDIDETANYILSILKYPELEQEMRVNGWNEVSHSSWEKAANECREIYNSVVK